MKKILCILVFALLMKNILAQTSSGISTPFRTAIQWTEGLSWKQVKEKARQENKYIFLDCFTTWCGPCKMMDRDVYANDSVGVFVNNKFIAVRVQMDRTKNDNPSIQRWYQDAAEIGKHYLLEGYPSFLFFNPGGAIVQKEMGFKEAGKFITMAQSALSPGKVLNDDYADYVQLMVAFKRGDLKYDRLPFMVTLAKKLGDTVSRELVRLHEHYVAALPTKERYTRENIAFWATLNLTSKSKILQYFFRDGNRIDQVMQMKGYARAEVDKSIQNFTVAPFINEQLKNPDAKSGVTTFNPVTGTVVSNTASYEEADWKKLQVLIRKDFGGSYVKRNLLHAKIIWYEQNSNWQAYVRTSFEKLKTFPPNLDSRSESGNINHLGWAIFLQIKDKELINEGIIWMEKLVQKWNKSDWIDTYANLLYKAGQKEEAIQWQEKAVSLDPADRYSQKALEQMKKGEPTYGVK